MPRILGIHGIGHYQFQIETGSTVAAAALLSSIWRRNLLYSLPRGTAVDLAVSYYADHLHRGTSHDVTDPVSALEPPAQDMLVAWVDLLLPQTTYAHGERTKSVRQAADWLTLHFGEAVRLLAMAFCREVHTYLNRPDSPRRSAARDAVAEMICIHQPDVIVAHSLGSVVAYEALWAHPGHDVDLFVTLGSPLAMPSVVFPRLRPNAHSKPPRVRRWVNFADIGDIVAIPRAGLAPYFAGIERDVDVTIGKNDFHTARGYLRCPEVARTVVNLL